MEAHELKEILAPVITELMMRNNPIKKSYTKKELELIFGWSSSKVDNMLKEGRLARTRDKKELRITAKSILELQEQD